MIFYSEVDINENTEESSEEVTTEIFISSPTDAEYTEQIDKIVSYSYASMILLFMITLYLFHQLLRSAMLKNTNEVK